MNLGKKEVKVNHTYESKKKNSFSDDISLALVSLLFFITGFLIDPKTASGNFGAFSFIAISVTTLVLSLLTLKKVLVERELDIPRSRYIVPLFILALMPLLTLLSDVNDWYRNIFNFDNSTFIFGYVFILAICLTNLYKDFGALNKLFSWAVGGLVLGSIVNGLLLIATIEIKDFDFINYKTNANEIVNNAIFSAIIFWVVSIYLLANNKKNNTVRYLFILSTLYSLFVLSISFNLGLGILLVLLSGVMLNNEKIREYTNLIGIQIIIIFLLGFYISTNGTISQYKKDLSIKEQANFIESAIVVKEALLDTNIVLGQGNREFTDMLKMYGQSTNEYEIKNTNKNSAGEIFDLISIYGFEILLPFGLLVLMLGKKITTDKTEHKNHLENFLDICFFTTLLTYILLGTTNQTALMLAIIIALIFSLKTKESYKVEISILPIGILASIVVGISLLLYNTKNIVLADFDYFKSMSLLNNRPESETSEEKAKRELSIFQSTLNAKSKDPRNSTYHISLAQNYLASLILNENQGNIAGESIVQSWTYKANSYSINAITTADDSYSAWRTRFELLYILPQVTSIDTREGLSEAVTKLEKLGRSDTETMLILANYYLNNDSSLYLPTTKKIYDLNPNSAVVIIEYAKALRLNGDLDTLKQLLDQALSDEKIGNNEQKSTMQQLLSEINIKLNTISPTQ